MNRKHLIAAALILAAVSASSAAPTQESAQATPQSKAPQAPKQTTATHDSHPQDEGQRIFDQNCSRCHTAPDGFSSRISGTIVRHMRVRASLSKHDEEELLRFFNP
jgi:mono/diheme cytochrome c family protein